MPSGSTWIHLHGFRLVLSTPETISLLGETDCSRENRLLEGVFPRLLCTHLHHHLANAQAIAISAQARKMALPQKLLSPRNSSSHKSTINWKAVLPLWSRHCGSAPLPSSAFGAWVLRTREDSLSDGSKSQT